MLLLLLLHCLCKHILCAGVCPSCLAGQQQQSFVVEFEEPSGSNPLMEMMMKVSGVCCCVSTENAHSTVEQASGQGEVKY